MEFQPEFARGGAYDVKIFYWERISIIKILLASESRRMRFESGAPQAR